MRSWDTHMAGQGIDRIVESLATGALGVREFMTAVEEQANVLERWHA